MHGAVSRKSFKPPAHVYKLFDLGIRIICCLKIRIGGKCLIKSHSELLRYHLRYLIHLRIRKIKCPSHITQYSACLKRTERNDLNHFVLAVFSDYIIYYFLSSFETEIHVYIGHGHTLGIKESLKKEAVPDRIDIGDP